MQIRKVGFIMEQDPVNTNGRTPMRTIDAIAIALALTLFVSAGLLILTGTSTPVEASSLSESSAWPIGPADLQVAEKHGKLDHAVLHTQNIKAEANPAPAAIANYDK
jgi:hypothetical protein